MIFWATMFDRASAAGADDTAAATGDTAAMGAGAACGTRRAVCRFAAALAASGALATAGASWLIDSAEMSGWRIGQAAQSRGE
jgi:hypothetical protein